MDSIELQGKDMTGDSRVASVSQVQQHVPGVTVADVDLHAGLVTVTGEADLRPAVSIALGATSPAPGSAASHCGDQSNRGALGHRSGGCCCGH